MLILNSLSKIIAVNEQNRIYKKLSPNLMIRYNVDIEINSDYIMNYSHQINYLIFNTKLYWWDWCG